ncbi:MAG: ribose 5-phosphate isomerase B [Spirochaetales bacterium]|uniref:Ribose 5-phosphate isomerase B n=1 Tax=Candidatus Thalassospirochaeta sargassi TaxID=3119039 RepID=A0AAJ1IEW3_9SPIO|nr:ribose 5-phosphate isomerase B [Spirochaetales bacterium]
MKIIIGNDHGAVNLKKQIIKHLETKGFECENIGVDTEDSVDYPDIAKIACEKYIAGGYDYGILCCGTGIGISISANKVDGIRCALPQDSFASHATRAHNNPNFIAFGGRIEYKDKIEDMLDSFFDTEFEGGRHQIRVDKIMAIEK